MEFAKNLNAVVGGAKFVIVQAMKQMYGPLPKAFYEVALGHPLVLTQIAALGEKKQDGEELNSADYAKLAKTLVDLGIGVVVLGGGVISLPVTSLVAFAGVVLFAYEHRDKLYDLEEMVAAALSEINESPYLIGVTCSQSFYYVDVEANSKFVSAINWTAPRDPLVLDLDDDGLETSGIDVLEKVLFDQKGDGVKVATGWIKADDGILVVDRNGNGLIDSGRELFGDNSILQYGPRAGQFASNGFEALADLDLNQDGIIDSSDAAYTEVKVWQDKNQDGISQASEMRTLADVGVASIQLNAAATSINLGGGNTQTWTGSFTRTSEKAGEPGKTGVIASLTLASNRFFREFTDDPVVTAAAKALPQMHGSGLVRDLREAQSLGNSQSEQLNQALKRYAAMDRDGQIASIGNLISLWGTTSSLMDAKKRYGEYREGEAITAFAAANPGVYARLTALEQFNGETIFDRLLTVHSASVWSEYAKKWVNSTSWTVDISGAQRDLLDKAWNALESSVYGALALQSRLAPFLDAIELVIDESGVRLDSKALYSMLDARHVQNERAALFDLVDIARYSESTFRNANFNSTDLLRSWMTEIPIDSLLMAELNKERVFFGNYNAYQNAGDDIVVGSNLNEIINTGGGADIADAGAGDDQLSGQEGNDRLYGGAGDDRLSGGEGNDFMDGGSGNDWLNGDQGTDTYVFGRGSGQDRIHAAYGVRTDILQINAGVSPGEVLIRRDNGSVVLSIVGTADSIYIENEMENDGDTEWGVNEIRFADGTVWNIDTMRARFLEGNDSAQNIVGYKFDDVINAGGGNDSILGQAGADRLYGGDGNDRISGGDGNDLIDGGAGNDWLNGDQGTDTYVFGRGSGRDLIHAAYGVRTDILQIAADVRPDEVSIGRDNGSVVLEITGTDDSIYIENELSNDGDTEWGVNEIRFADGTVWNIDTMRARFLEGNDGAQNIVGYKFDDVINAGGGNDSILGQAGADRLYGGDGNDRISGGDGNDLIDGGAGNDWLNGDQGTDTYVFGRGSGQDQIHAAYGFRTDILQIAAGILPDEVSIRRDNGSVVLSIIGTDDSIYIENELENDGDTEWGVNEIRFADGTVWNIDTMRARFLEGNDSAQNIVGYKFDDVINAGGGNDSILGQAGADRLNGGAGDDRISGGDGNDLIDGGAGNDWLNGDQGTDTYVFGRGSGRDLIHAAYGVRTDILQIAADVRPDEVSIRRGNGSVVLKITGTDDSIYIENELENDGDTEWGVNEIRFADGTVWNIDTMRARFLEGNDGAQNIVGYKFDDVINAGGGNDSILGQAGADRLYGGDGNDRISGGDGNDLIDGGAGNDWLNGDQGTDTYVFGRGSGQDQIHAAYGFRTDILQIAAGILPDEVSIRRDNGSVVLSIIGTDDSIYIENELENDGDTEWGVNEIRFADGTVWNIDTMRARFLEGNDGAQNIVGYKFDDVINAGGGNDSILGQGGADGLYGGDGDDRISGGDGNDLIDGGAGNDWMNGDQGTDTYVFGRGSGQDVIHAAYGVRTDILQILEGLRPEDIILYRSGANLMIGIEGSNDSVRIDNELENEGNTEWGVDFIKFFDGSAWNIDDIKSVLLDPTTFHAASAELKVNQAQNAASTQSLIQAMASFSPPAAGEVLYSANDPTNLQPLLAANWQ